MFFVRLIFAVLATALVARAISSASDILFFKAFFHKEERRLARLCGCARHSTKPWRMRSRTRLPRVRYRGWL
ncbi:exported hypothetical protein [Mesorhizobium prunaredense]|uniref:Secreted protein n=1 Tax=Mesorhizobium prunaredense TaxID=1631249 RepID=A0A1R3V3T2_9HYPH|nr:exported hypothetical protein [Mesorhizobium prunaredense]